MVRRSFFSTIILILGINQLVSGSTNETNDTENTPSTILLNAAHLATSGYELINVPSASSDLPQPPSASTDFFNYATVLKERNPKALKNYNASTPRTEMKKIPSGLHRVYEEIKGEMAWFNKEKTDETSQKARNDALITLFGHIVNDRVGQFFSFESEFQRIFGTDYGNFSSMGRSVLGWLVAFGSVEILRSLPLQQYKIDRSNLDVSIKYLVNKHLFSHIAKVVASAPFLIKATLPNGRTFLDYIMNKPNGIPIENLANFFVELPSVNLSLIAALIQILPNGSGPQAMSELLAKVKELTVCIRTLRSYEHLPHIREKAINNIKFALQLFLDRCITDFKQIQLGDRFTVALLFIDAANVNALNRLLQAHEDMLHTLANGKSLLQHAINSSSFQCASLIVSFKPESVTQVYNRLQSPFVQSVTYNNSSYFDLFLPYLTSNDPIPFVGSQLGLRPTVIAMIHGNIPFLRQLVQIFKIKNCHFDLRADFEVAFDYLEAEYKAAAECSRIRDQTLISHSLWLYLIEEAQIENEHPAHINHPLRRSLLDLAVLDRNPEIARHLIQTFGFKIVNERCTEGTLQGNCLRFINNDLIMLRVLVANGVDLNTPMIITTVYDGDDEFETKIVTKETPVLARLLMTYDQDIVDYVRTLNFSPEALEFALKFAREGFLGACARVAIDLLWERYQIKK